MATKTLNIALDEKLLKDIDASVKRDMGTRSEYFQKLALADLDRRQKWEELFAAGRVVGKRIGSESTAMLSALSICDINDGGSA